MHASIDGHTLRLLFDDADDAATFMREAVEQRAFMVGVDTSPKPLATYRAELGDTDFTFEARAVQFFPGGGELQAAFAIETWAEDQQRALDAAFSRAEADESESRGASPAFRLRDLDPGARARLAMKADRTERRILRRDQSPQVLRNLLSNPRVGADDVLAIVKAPSVNASILLRIGEDRRWMANTEIKTALVRQPKTPTKLAIKMIEGLRTEDLRQMSKMGNLRETVRRAVFRVYQRRQSSR